MESEDFGIWHDSCDILRDHLTDLDNSRHDVLYPAGLAVLIVDARRALKSLRKATAVGSAKLVDYQALEDALGKYKSICDANQGVGGYITILDSLKQDIDELKEMDGGS
jgi:hypothetical protein